MPRRGLRSDSGDGRREQVDGLEEESHRRIRSHSRIAGASHGVRRKANGQLSEEVSASEALPGWSLHPPSCLHRSARWHLLGPTSRSAKKPKRGPGAWRHTSRSQGSGLAYSPSSSSLSALGIQGSSRPGLALEGREEEGTGNDAARGAASRTSFAFAGDGEEEEEGEQEEDSGGGGGGERGGDGICDAQAVSINSGCLGGFPIGVGCAVSGEGGLAFAVQSEATSPGTGELILTGKIGKSMAESCMVALSWVKAKKRDLCLWMSLEGEDGEGGGCLVDLHRPDLDVHVNFPSCEAEKNGPSAGATVATSLVLMMTGAQLLPNIAISGEINLQGDLLPIGNVKEKVAAAARQGITHIVLSSANVKQFRRLPARIRNAVKALKANHIVEVLKHAVLPPGGRGYQARYEHRLREVAGLGLAASLACSHVKGRVQWVECCATTGRGEWHITGNILEGTRGSVLVARTWVRRNAAAIVARLGGKTSVQVELCALHGLGPAWRLRGKGSGAVGPALAAGTPSLPLEPSRRSNGKHPLSPPPGTLASGDPALLPPPQLDLHIHMPGTDVAKDVSINGAAAAVSMIAVMTGLAVRPGKPRDLSLPSLPRDRLVSPSLTALPPSLSRRCCSRRNHPVGRLLALGAGERGGGQHGHRREHLAACPAHGKARREGGGGKRGEKWGGQTAPEEIGGGGDFSEGGR